MYPAKYGIDENAKYILQDELESEEDARLQSLHEIGKSCIEMQENEKETSTGTKCG